MFISPAYAQAAGGGFGGMESLLPLVLIFVVFYFLLIRPQQKKQKEHKAMLEALHRGDRIVTSGGIIGTITKVHSDTELIVEIAEGVKVRVARGMIADVLSKTEGRDATNDNSNDDNSDDEEKPESEEKSGKKKK
ncbi:MAG: preprotein translocase subunit YajC [Alphaproteobacteria bacterium]|jgi:preprotein translocase subunit YajC